MVAHTTATRVQEVLRARLFDKILALGPAWFGSERTGGVMLSMVDGVEQLQTFFGQYLPQVAIALVAPVAIFFFIAWWDLPVAAVMLGAALFTLFLPATVHRKTARASGGRQRAFKSFGEEFLDAVQGLPTLKAFGQSKAYGAMLGAKAKALSDATFWVLALNVLTRGFTDLGTAVGAAAALALGAWRVQHGEMSLEALLIVLMAGTEIFRPLRDLRTVLHAGMNGQSAANGINALLDTPVTAPGVPAHPESLAGVRPEIAFDNVSFAYPGGRRPAHTGLSFTIAAGERVGIVGPSGSGKSSIVRLLLRLHDPQAGAIRIGGHDLRALDPDAVRGMIAVVSQDTWLFHGTVEENLRLGRPDATEADLVAAARAANAHEFIMGLPDGYQTAIGERGSQLSGGQRQRLAIARALLRDAPILVLDEALSSVDAENEAVIQQALDRLMTGRTTLILAHRLSSVIGADRILVLEDGAVVQSGSHAVLIAQEGPYRRLMGPQVAETRDSEIVLAEPAARQAETTETSAVVTSIADDAASVGWPETIRTLMHFVWPYKGQLGIVMVCGILRVIAFIGVGVIGALLLGAVRNHQPTTGLVVALLITAPLAGDSALARIVDRARDGLRAAGGDADPVVPETRCAGAGVFVAPALRRSGRAGDAGRRDGGVFLRSHHRPRHRRVPGAGGGADRAAGHRVAVGDRSGAVPDLRRRLADARPRSASMRWARRRAALWAGSARTFRKRSRAWANWWRSMPPDAAATGSWTRCGNTRRRGCACSPI